MSDTDDYILSREDERKSERKLVVRVLIEGKVQGVGYRNWLRARALERGINGWVRNKSDGRVEALLGGVESNVKELVADCYRGPPASVVKRVKEFPETNLRDYTQGFMVLPSM